MFAYDLSLCFYRRTRGLIIMRKLLQNCTILTRNNANTVRGNTVKTQVYADLRSLLIFG